MESVYTDFTRIYFAIATPKKQEKRKKCRSRFRVPALPSEPAIFLVKLFRLINDRHWDPFIPFNRDSIRDLCP